MKKILSIFFLILITSCGYTPIYSSKNFLFEIGEINYERNQINNQLVRSLELISNTNAKTLNINLSSTKEKTVVSKQKLVMQNYLNSLFLLIFKYQIKRRLFLDDKNIIIMITNFSLRNMRLR